MGGGSSKDNDLARFQSKSVPVSGIAAAIGERSVTAGGSKKLINVSGYVKAQDAQKITVFGRSEGVIASCIVGKAGTDVATSPFFAAYENSSFYLVDNKGDSILVQSSTGPGKRKYYINSQSHKENYIVLDPNSGQILSATTKGEKTKNKQDAKCCFDMYGDDTKHWDASSVSDCIKHCSEKIPWAAEEAAVPVGTPVAVIGQVKVDKHGEMSIVPMFITDSPEICPELKDGKSGPSEDIDTIESFSTDRDNE
ncbi:hypothetical protein TrCOL_g11331 [Triparma columacea]|uniref:Uncharacterized protein n=1 Tax=Triparma columacea TaxID=722753 RepID=A0A9W7GE33_9STRA|nr:hypothetical protein TrCOL_g11331 [Triparma columacea]